MAKVNELISARFKKNPESLPKMNHLSGNLSSFTGVFRLSPLSEIEEEKLEALLSEYKGPKQEIEQDLRALSSLTAEVKAINNQAAILHGERIKKAQEILKKYRDGAFSSWLIATYGNRQTPYNFLQYYELYMGMPQTLQAKVDEMPRQAIYTLASRKCSKEEKETFIQNYCNETKKQLLALIREKFPLAEQDKRTPNRADQILTELRNLEKEIKKTSFRANKEQKESILEVLASIQKNL